MAGVALLWFAYGRVHLGGWRTHVDPMGFAVEIPRDWTVRPDPASGRIQIRGTKGEQATVWPLFASGSLEPKTVAVWLPRLAARVWPEARWESPQRLGPRVVRVSGRTTQRQGVCLTTWVVSPKGSAGFVYLLSSPPARRKEAETTFARILQGFELRGAPLAPPSPKPRHVRWEDPNERAFSVEIPSGWRAEGGALRPNLLVVQAKVEVSSPDGAISLFMGDAFPVFTEPNPALAMAGIGPGGIYVDPMGDRVPVAHYVPGAAFARRQILPERLGAFTVVREKTRPDVARRLVTLGLNRFDAGEIEYGFVRAGAPCRGWLLCITERIAAPGGANWHVWRLYIAEAPPSRFEEASVALTRLAETFRIDANWARMQARLTAEQSRIIGEMGEAVSRTISETYQLRQDTMDEIARRGANARREVDELADLVTGRELTVASGSSYYWVDPRGTVVGTETHTRPAVDFRELVRLP